MISMVTLRHRILSSNAELTWIGAAMTVALLCAFVGGSPVGAAALTNSAPDKTPTGGYGGSDPRYVLERTPANTVTSVQVPVYLPNRPTGPVSVSGIEFNYPWAGYTPAVSFNNGPFVTGATNFTVPAANFRLDPSTGYYEALVTARLDASPSSDFNIVGFRIRVNVAGGLIGISGNSSYSTLSTDYYTPTAGTTYNYDIPFATPCTVSSNQRQTIRLRDLDSGHIDNRLNTVTVRVFDETDNRTLGAGDVTYTGSMGDLGIYNIEVLFRPNHKYRLIVNNVHANNSLIYTFPYDNIAYAVGCDWTLSGTSSVNQATAQVGDLLTWTHRVVNNGRGTTSSAIATDVYQSHTATVRHPSSTNPGIAAGGLVRSITSTYRVTMADVGRSLCQQVRWTPGGSAIPARRAAALACTTVPYNFNLVPTVANLGNVVDPGADVTVNSSVNNTGATHTPPTVAWQLSSVIVRQGRAIQTAVAQNGSDPCTHFRNGANNNTCAVLDSSTFSFPRGVHTFSPHSTAVPDNLLVGDRFCFALSVRPYAHNQTNWRHSIARCVKVGGKPKLQVWGGDVRTRGAISTSTTSVGGRVYGSWVEYASYSIGTTTDLASGSGLIDGSLLGLPDRSRLTFANVTPANGNAYGNFSLQAPRTPLADQFVGRTAVTLPASTTSLALGSVAASTTYQTAASTLTISGDVGQDASGRGKTIVIISSGTVVIDGNITYRGPSGDTFTTAAQLPQVVIVARNIHIRNSATNVDAWLLTTAGGTINTCIDVAAGGNLSSAVCNAQLTVNGPVSTDRLYLHRTTGGADPGQPAEIFKLRPDAYMWGYGQAAQGGKAQTVYSTELPPRF